jgi:hypothetical protein
VIQNVELVGDWDASIQEFADRPDDVARRHVAARVIVFADNQDAGIMALHDLHKTVKVAEVIMVSREEDTIRAGGLTQMKHIFGAG